MTKYQCSVCGYTSSQKNPVLRHFNKQKSCGIGDKKIIETTENINECEYCNKFFSTAQTLAYHIKKSCPKKIESDEIVKLKEKIIKLENKLKDKPEEKSIVINNNINNINNDNRIYNITLINYEKTKLDRIPDNVITGIIKDADTCQLIPRFIQAVHFNPNIPENTNVYISNKNNKYVKVYNDNQWELRSSESEIENIINDKETSISEWLYDKKEKYPETVDKFEDYLDQRSETENNKFIKEGVELILYNNRHLVK